MAEEDELDGLMDNLLADLDDLEDVLAAEARGETKGEATEEVTIRSADVDAKAENNQDSGTRDLGKERESMAEEDNNVAEENHLSKEDNLNTEFDNRTKEDNQTKEKEVLTKEEGVNQAVSNAKVRDDENLVKPEEEDTEDTGTMEEDKEEEKVSDQPHGKEEQDADRRGSKNQKRRKLPSRGPGEAADAQNDSERDGSGKVDGDNVAGQQSSAHDGGEIESADVDGVVVPSWPSEEVSEDPKDASSSQERSTSDDVTPPHEDRRVDDDEAGNHLIPPPPTLDTLGVTPTNTPPLEAELPTDSEEDEDDRPSCDRCWEEVATLHCHQCEKVYCHGCSERLHQDVGIDWHMPKDLDDEAAVLAKINQRKATMNNAGLVLGDDIDMCGYLFKLGKAGLIWKKFWVTFHNDHLVWFKDKGDAAVGCVHLGTEGLAGKVDISLTKEALGNGASIPAEGTSIKIAVPGRDYYFRGTTVSDVKSKDETTRWSVILEDGLEFAHDHSLPCAYRALRPKTNKEKFSKYLRSTDIMRARNMDKKKVTSKYNPHEDVVKRGVLLKLGGFTKSSWQGRHFVLQQNGTLFYFLGAQEDEPQGNVQLHTGDKVARYKDKKQAHSFSITTLEKTHIVAAESSGEMDDWMSALRDVIELQCTKVESLPPLKAGYLSKKGERRFQKRWFVLQGTSLKYFASHKDSVPKQVVELKAGGACKVEYDPSVSTECKMPCLRLTRGSEKEYILASETMDETQAWIEAIKNVL